MDGRDQVRWDLAQGFIKKTTQEWLDILLAEDIWCAPVNTMDDAEDDPQIAENKMIIEWEHPVAGKIRTTGIPFRLSETPGGVFMPPPALGQHTNDILRDVGGYEEGEIEELRSMGAVV